MKKQLINGLTTLLLPFATYAATGTLTNSYHRAYGRGKTQALGELPLQTTFNTFPNDILLPNSLSKMTWPKQRLSDSAHTNLTLERGQKIKELVIIDAAVPEKNTLYRGLMPGIEAIEISSDSDGLAQLVHALENYRDIAAVHFVTHASDGKILLGNAWISVDDIKQRADVFTALNQSVIVGGDLLFYGCDLAASHAGEEFLEIVSNKTQLDTAASSNKTGSSILNGDWELEITKGDINSAVPFSENALRDFSVVLAPATYTGLQLYSDNTGTNSYYNQTSITTGDNSFVLSGVSGNNISVLSGSAGIGYVYAAAETGFYGKSLQVAADGTNVGTFELNTLQLSVYASVCSPSDITANVTIEGYYPGGTSAGSQNVTVATAPSNCGYADVDTVDVSGTFGAGKSLSKFVIKYNGIAPSDRYYLMTSFTVDNLRAPGNTPTISIDNTNLTYTEGDSATQIDSAATVSDADGDADWNGGTLVAQITGNAEAGDRLSISDTDSDGTTITISGFDVFANATDIGDLSLNANGGIVTNGTALTITFDSDATNANVQEVLQSLRYDSTSQDPGTSNRVVTITATDNRSASANDTRTISVTAVNDEPTLTATGSNPTFTEGGAAASLFSSSSVSTVESGQTISALTLTVTNLADGSNERLNVDGSAIILTHGTSGTTATNSLSYSVSVVGGTATVSLTGGTMSAAATQTVVDAMSYQNNSNTPSTSNRVITITSLQDSGGTINGGDNTAALAVASTVTVTEVNDEPTLTATGTNPTFSEGGPAAGLFTGASASTIEAGQTLTGFTLTVTNLANGSSEILNADGTAIALTNGGSGTTATNSLSYSVAVSGSTATVTFNGGTVSAAALQTLVNALSYQNNASDPNTANRVFTITSLTDSGSNTGANDNVAALAIASTVTVVGVNNEPTLTATGNSPTFTEDGAAASLFSGASASTVETGQTLTGFTVTITNLADGSSEILNADGTAITLTNGTSGTTAANSLSYSVAVSGSTATVTFSGGTLSTAALQTLIDALSYQNNAIDPNTTNRVITITSLTDSGSNTGANDNISTLSIASTVTVVGVNDEPTLTATGSDPTFTEGGAAASLFSGSSASTVESGQTLSAFTLTVTNVADGSDEVLNADGTAIALTNSNSGTTATSSLSYSVSVAGSTATVSFSGGTLSTAALQTLVDSLSYQNNSDDPSTTSRVVTVTSLQDSGGIANGGDNTAALSLLSTVAVTAVNDQPTDISLDSSSVNQSSGLNAVVGNLSSTDVDSTSFTYTLVAGTGDTDNGSFNINGSQLRANNATALSAGNYSVRVQTNDGSNNYQKAFTLTVIDDVAPSVSSVTVPANGTYKTADNLDFTVNYNEAVTVNTSGGTPRLVLTIGATTRYASYVSGSGSSALVFRHSVNTGDVDSDGIALSGTLDANGGSLADAASNSANLTLNSVASLASVLVDAQAPTISETAAVTTPGNDTTPNLTFSSNEAGTLAVGGSCGTSSSTSVSTGSNTITLTQADNSSPLAQGSYSDCTITVTDAAGNASTALSLSSFTIDTTPPTVAEVTAVLTPGNDNTPSVTISSNENGNLAIGGSCGSGSEGAVSTGNITLSLTQTDNSTQLADGTYSDCTATVTDAAGNASTPVTLSSFVVDTAGPTLAEVTAVASPTSDNTPNVVFSSTEAGTVSVGGSCGTSSTTTVSSGNNTLTLTATDDSSALSDNTYTDCTLTVTDASGNASSPLTLSSFIVDIAAPTVAEVTAVTTPGNDTTPSVTISSSEAGTLAVGGSCGSSDEGAISAGNTTITLTGTNNSSPLVDGSYSNCTVTIIDAGGNTSNTLTLTAFTIDASAPNLATNSGLSINEGDTDTTIGSSQLSATDNLSNATNTTYTLVSTVGSGTLRNNGTALGNGASFTQADIASNRISYDHDGGESTSDSFTFTLSDALGNLNNNSSANFTYSISVTAVNDAPDTSDDSASTNEDNAVAIDVLANDSDSDDAINAASVIVTTAPANGSTSVNTATGVITYTPAANYNGSDSFSYTVQDATGDTSAPATVSITVNAVNDAPVATDDTASADINTPVTINVAANDSDVDTGDAVDTNTLAIVSNATNGTAVINAGQIDYTPNTGYLGSDSFTYTINDGNGATSNVATVTISVIDPNTAPSALNDSASTDEDSAVSIDVLANDNDPDGSLVVASVTVVTDPANGSTSVDASTGAITYTPAANYNGSDSFTYTVDDDAGATSVAATVSVTINAVNDAPVATNDTVVLLEDASLLINVLGNDSDIDGSLDSASLTVVTQPAHGVAVLDGSSILYTPLDDFAGDDSFSYTVDDNDGLVSNTATVTLTVNPVNDAPLANDDSFTLVANAASVLNITSNDSDVDGSLDGSSLVLVTQPTQGTVVNNNDGTVSYTPNPDISPLAGDSFSYTINDDSGATSGQATVTLSFEPASVPVLSGQPDTDVVEGQTYSFTPAISGADTVFTLTYSIANAPAWVNFSSTTGALTGSPSATDVGTTTGVVISVSDGINTASLPAFNLEVIADVDTDGDTISDYQEVIDGTDPNDALDYLDLTPPTVLPPSDILVDASGLFTPVSLAQALSLADDSTSAEIEQAINDLVTDNVDGDGCCNLTPTGLSNNQFLLAPGDNIIRWQAQDFMQNSTSVNQHIYVRPLVTLSKNQETVEGADVQVQVLLNGKAPFYPFEVPYYVSSDSTATSSDHTLVDGSVVFSEGQTSAPISFRTLADSVSENDETVIIRLNDHTSNAENLLDGFEADIYDINSGTPDLFTLTIVERNVPPKLRLGISQDGKNTIQVVPDGGEVTIKATVTDPNVNDNFTLDWSGTDSALNDTSADPATLVFSPASLSPGRYKVKAKATDSGSATNTDVLHFLVVATLPSLSAETDTDDDGIDDASEGTADGDSDGIPDYLDNITLTNVLPEKALETDRFLIECDPGIRCRLGQFSIQTETGGAHIPEQALAALTDLEDDKGYTSTGLFDFEMVELPQAGQSASVVIPQIQPIPANAVYRKFANNQWFTFHEDANNSIASTQGNEGFCPPPGDVAWQPGLSEGHWCVQLTIEDGGPNDADAETNGSVADPGGVATRDTRRVKTGGGATGTPLILLLGLLLLIRQRHLKHSKNLLPLLAVIAFALPGQSKAADLSSFFVELNLTQNKSNQSSYEFMSDLSNNGVTASVLSYDAKDMGMSLSIGHQYNSYLAAMIGYANFGKASAELDIEDEDDETLISALENSYPHLGKSLTGNARLSYPLGELFNIYADLGIHYWQSTIDVENSSVEGDVSGVDPWLGFGAKVRYQQFDIGLQYRRFYFDDVGLDSIGMGIGWWFGE